MLAEALSVDVALIAQAIAVIAPAVAAVAGYTTLRANSMRNTERIDKIDGEHLPSIRRELDSFREWRAREEGAARVRAEIRGDKSEPMQVSGQYSHHTRRP